MFSYFYKSNLVYAEWTSHPLNVDFPITNNLIEKRKYYIISTTVSIEKIGLSVP